MSVVGLSPSDFVNGARVLGRGASALKEDGGSKDKYRQVSENFESRTAALKHLERFAASASPTTYSVALNQAASILRRRDENEQMKTQKYDIALGRNARPGRKHGVARKLGWEFSRDQEVQSYNARTAPGVDAAILESILLGAHENRERDAKLSALTEQTATLSVHEIQSRMTDISQQIDRMAGNIVSASEVHRDHLHDHITDAQRQLVSQHARGVQQITELISTLNLDPRHAYHESKMQRPSWLQWPFSDAMTNSPRCLKTSFLRCPSTLDAESVSQDSHVVTFADISHDRRLAAVPNFKAEAGLTALLVATCIIYKHPLARKAFQKLSAQAREDTVFIVLITLTIICGLGLARHIPRHLSLLSDSSLTFEDPFGSRLRVPYVQCLHYEIFHGFIEYYFKTRPGLRRVLRKQYQLMVGTGKHHSRVDGNDWTDKIKPRTQIMMIMLMVTGDNSCAKCGAALVQHGPGHFRCPTCGQTYFTAPSCSMAAGESVEELEDEEEHDHLAAENESSNADDSFNQMHSRLPENVASALEPRESSSNALESNARSRYLKQQDLLDRGVPAPVKPVEAPQSIVRPPADFLNFKHMALLHSDLRKSLGEAESLVGSYPDCRGGWQNVVIPNDNCWDREYYKLEKRHYSWNDTIRTLLDTDDLLWTTAAFTIAIPPNMDNLLIFRSLNAMSRSRRAEILRLISSKNAGELNKKILWYVTYIKATESRIKQSPGVPARVEVFAMEVVIAKGRDSKPRTFRDLKLRAGRRRRITSGGADVDSDSDWTDEIDQRWDPADNEE